MKSVAQKGTEKYAEVRALESLIELDKKALVDHELQLQKLLGGSRKTHVLMNVEETGYFILTDHCRKACQLLEVRTNGISYIAVVINESDSFAIQVQFQEYKPLFGCVSPISKEAYEIQFDKTVKELQNKHIK